MAPVDGKISDEVRAIGEVFRQAGMAAEVVESVDAVIWQKLVHNSVVNPISALTGMNCSELLEDDDMQGLMRALCLEIAEVMKARGTPLEDAEDPYRPIVRSQKALARNRPSMWQDLVRGFRTEIDAMNGGIVAEAERLGMKAPLNWAIVQLIHSRERQQQRRQERGAATLAEVKEVQAKLPSRPVSRAPFAGMPQGRVPLESAPRLKEIVAGYWRELGEAGRARNVAWCSTHGPVEIARALGFVPYFPENHAALIGASRLTAKYIRLALADGFSPFAPSEMASDVGAMLAGETPAGRAPRPDRRPAPVGARSTAPTSASTWPAGSSTTATGSGSRCSASIRRRRSTRWRRSRSTTRCSRRSGWWSGSSRSPAGPSTRTGWPRPWSSRPAPPSSGATSSTWPATCRAPSPTSTPSSTWRP